jgi:hypothetical protein
MINPWGFSMGGRKVSIGFSLGKVLEIVFYSVQRDFCGDERNVVVRSEEHGKSLIHIEALCDLRVKWNESEINEFEVLVVKFRF